MNIPASIRASLPGLYQVALHPIVFGPGLVSKENTTVTLQQAVLKQQKPGNVATICFVVRRPG